MKKNILVCAVGILVLLGIAFSGFSKELAWEKVNWNAPVPLYQRVMGEKYILPEGWKEAVKGIDSIAFINSGTMEYDPAMAESIRQFEELTGIKCKYQEIGEADINTKQTTILRAKLSDLDLIFTTTFSEPYMDYVAAGWLMPVDMLWNDKIASVFSRSIRDILKIDGHIYGFPYIGWTPLFHYRDDLLKEAGFDRPPMFWDELVEYAQKLTIDTNGDGVVDRYGFCYHAGDRFSTMMMLGQLLANSGGGILQNRKVVIDTPEAERAVQFLFDLRNKYKVVPPGVNTYSYTEPPNLFAADKVAMMVTGNWAHLVVSSNKEIFKHYRMTQFPTLNSSIPSQSFFDFSFYSVSAYSKKKAAALLFLDFLRSYQARHNEVYIEKNVVPNKKIWLATEVMEEVPYVDVLSESIGNAVQWVYPQATKVSDIVHAAVGRILLGTRTVKGGLVEAQKEIDSIYR